MFKLSVPTHGQTNGFNAEKPAALATVKGSLYKRNLTTGVFEQAAASATASEELYVCNETTATTDMKPVVNVLITYKGDEYVVDTVANSNTAHNGQRMVLDATGALLNNTGTDAAAGIFTQKGVVGAPADKKITAVRV